MQIVCLRLRSGPLEIELVGSMPVPVGARTRDKL